MSSFTTVENGSKGDGSEVPAEEEEEPASDGTPGGTVDGTLPPDLESLVKPDFEPLASDLLGGTV